MSKTFFYHTLIEFGPLVLFFFISALWGFYPGANALVISTLIALLFSFCYFKRFAWFSFTVSTFTLLSGIATLYLHQPIWIVLEFTLSNLLFGVILVCAHSRGNFLLKSLFKHMFLINEKGWGTITIRWGWTFILIGSTNQLFWYLFPDENLWTLFRFVATILTLIFALAQLSVARRERLPDSSAWGLRK